MPANRIHLIRHGEVHNPGGVLYGRLPHFHLTEAGHEMARMAAEELKRRNYFARESLPSASKMYSALTHSPTSA
jgi:broad specificity phosphatase PhoE